MKNLIRFILFSFCISTFSSCATIINKSHKNIRFLSDKEPVSFHLDNDTTDYQTNIRIPVKRNSNSLQINVRKENDSIATFLLPPQYSKTFLYGNIPLGGNYGIGWLIDVLTSKETKKVLSYPSKVMLSEDTLFVYPYISLFSTKPVAYYLTTEDKTRKKYHLSAVKSSITFDWSLFSIYSINRKFFNKRYTEEFGLGMGVGLDYYLQPDLTLSADIDGMFHTTGSRDNFFYRDNTYRETYTAFLTKIQLNKKLSKNNWLGLGLQMNNTYSREREFEIIAKDYYYIENDYPYHYFYQVGSRERIKKEYKNNYGPAFSFQHKMKTYSFKLDYSPSFLSQTTKKWKFEYNHLISISLTRSFWVKR